MKKDDSAAQEIKKLQTRLQAAQKQIKALTSFQEESYAPILRISSDGKVLYNNIAALPVLREWGCKVNQQLPNSLLKQHPELLNTQNITAYKKIEFKHFTVGFTIVPIHEKGDIILYGNEIDRIKTLEDTLADRERMFYTLIENSKTILFSWKFEGLWPVKFVSENISQFGYNSEDFVSGKINFASIIHPNDLENVVQEAQNNIAQKLSQYEQEYRIITKSGKVRWVLDRTLVKEENSEKFHEGVIVDITEQKLMHEKLMQSEANLFALIENAKDAAFSVDLKCRLIAFNTIFRKSIKLITGKYPLAGMMMQKLFLKDKDVKLWEQFFNRVFKGEQFTDSYQRMINNKHYYFEVSFNPIQAAEGLSIKGATVFLKDVTKYKEYEKVLNKQNQELKKINFELDRFVYSASHDLKAPLRSIMGVLNLAKDECKNPRQVEYMGMIRTSINKLDDFIADLIDYSRNSRQPVEKQRIDFNKMIPEILEGLKYLDTSVNSSTKTDFSQLPPFYSDPRRVSIILHNIFANAIKYQKHDKAEEALVKISIKYPPKQVVIEIKDNGIGIDKKHQKKIFNMFYRATDKSDGSGLGLYIVKETVKKLKGKIHLKSVLGKGTTITVTLPNHAP